MQSKKLNVGVRYITSVGCNSFGRLTFDIQLSYVVQMKSMCVMCIRMPANTLKDFVNGVIAIVVQLRKYYIIPYSYFDQYITKGVVGFIKLDFCPNAIALKPSKYQEEEK